ncbi:MAG: hypothetical protein LUC25_04055 [Ruminococcus sp.]|nr:hypothetical protein [Ruminococcus sp.]
MKKFTAIMLSLLLAGSLLTACNDDDSSSEDSEENEVVCDTFIVGGVWEAILKTSDTEGEVIAYKFKEDGTFYFFENLYATVAGYYEHDEDAETLVLTNSTGSDEIDLTCTYQTAYDEEDEEDKEYITIEGPLLATSDSDEREDVTITFVRLSSEDEAYYSEDTTYSYALEKVE